MMKRALWHCALFFSFLNNEIRRVFETNRLFIVDIVRWEQCHLSIQSEKSSMWLFTFSDHSKLMAHGKFAEFMISDENRWIICSASIDKYFHSVNWLQHKMIAAFYHHHFVSLIHITFQKWDCNINCVNQCISHTEFRSSVCFAALWRPFFLTVVWFARWVNGKEYRQRWQFSQNFFVIQTPFDTRFNRVDSTLQHKSRFCWNHSHANIKNAAFSNKRCQSKKNERVFWCNFSASRTVPRQVR